jgi:hypothetical protein
MADFEFTVDTRPMAQTVNGVTHHVDATTVAVTGMGAAVVAAENAAAEHISHEVTRGFHALMVSQISQKRALAKSNMDAKLLELTYHYKALMRIKAQMQADFNRIAARYGKLFQTLNDALRSRIFELDNPSASLSLTEHPLLQQRQLTQASLVPTHQLETLPASQQIAVAQAKKNAVQVLTRMRDNIVHAARLRDSTQAVIYPEGGGIKALHQIPVLISEGDDLNLDLRAQRLAVAGGNGQAPQLRLAVESRVAAVAAELAWKKVDAATRDQVRSKCAALVTRSAMNEREKKVFSALLSSSDWETLSGGKS